MKKKFILFLFGFLFLTAAWSEPTLQQRFKKLTEELRCVVCQNQNLSDSNAPLASDLRGKIYHLLEEKKTDDEIKEYLVQRYGEFILFSPRFNAHTVVLWTFPFIGLALVGLIFLNFFIRARKRARARVRFLRSGTRTL